MSRKHVAKQFAENSYYHLFNRGNEKRTIFIEPEDFRYFLGLIARYLSPVAMVKNTHEYPTFYIRIKIHGYCLMSNHFHIILSQTDTSAMWEFMKCLQIAYSMYFNKKYDRKGYLFESTYKAKIISDESYLCQVSRYIDLNPKHTYASYENSSYQYLTGKDKPYWLETETILSYFPGDTYKYFVEDYYRQKKLEEDIFE